MADYPTKRELLGAVLVILFPVLVFTPAILLSLYGFYLLHV